MSDSRRTVLIVVCTLLGVLETRSPSHAQKPVARYDGTNAQVVDFGQALAPAIRQFAVVGDVDRPGVYETRERKVVRAKLLKAAGSRATMGDYYTTYHRGLRPEPMALFDAEATEAAHGDVIVVSGKDRGTRTDETAPIHVAVIGLMPDPVVVRLQPAERSIAGLLSRLRQQREAAAGSTVNGAKSEKPLKNGDVVALNSHLVDRSVLIDCEALLAPRELDPPPPRETTHAPAPIERPEIRVAQLPAFELPAVPVVVITERNEELALASTPAPIPEAIASPSPAQVATVLDTAPALRSPRSAPRRQVAKADHQVVDRVVAQKPVAAGSDSSIRLLVGSLAVATFGLGLALIWLTSERRLQGTAPPKPVAVTPITPPLAQSEANDDFDELVRGQLAIEDEPVVLPSRISLHGQAVGQKRLIVHSAEPLAGPHFSSAVPAEKASVAVAVQPDGPHSQSARASVTTPVRSAKDMEGLLDRVLLAMQREGRK